MLGVHIADVSHYVRPGSALDLEAWERGTSVYFADQVVPMLPRELSNGICSLNPRVDRLALSCVMTLTPEGEVVDHTIAKSVIRTTERMTYEDCNALLSHSDPALAERYARILPMLEDMAALSRVLEGRRRRRGAWSWTPGRAMWCATRAARRWTWCSARRGSARGSSSPSCWQPTSAWPSI